MNDTVTDDTLAAEFETHADEALHIANDTFAAAAETWPGYGLTVEQIPRPAPRVPVVEPCHGGNASEQCDVRGVPLGTLSESTSGSLRRILATSGTPKATPVAKFDAAL